MLASRGMMKRLAFSFSLLACGGQEPAPVTPPPEPVPPATAMVSIEPAPTPPPPVAMKEPPPAADPGPPGPPPPATWEYTVNEKSNTCPGVDAGTRSPTVGRGLFIPSHPAKDGAIVASIKWPSTATFVMQQDVRLEVEKPVSMTVKPDRACPSYEVKRDLVFREITGNTMVMSVRMEYGDAKGCAKPPIHPTSCKSDVLVTYKLLETLCEPRCIYTNGRLSTTPDAGPPTGKCVCPDAGAP